MKRLYIMLLLTMPACLSAQQIERSILSSAGYEHSASNSMSLEWTLGELAVTTASNSEFKLTQGFHQPFTKVYTHAAEVTFNVWPNPTADNVTVTANQVVPEATIYVTDMRGRLLKINKL